MSLLRAAKPSVLLEGGVRDRKWSYDTKSAQVRVGENGDLWGVVCILFLLSFTSKGFFPKCGPKKVPF